MRIIPVIFIAILVLTMTTSSSSLMYPQDPVSYAFAQSTEDSIHDLGNYVVFGFDEVELEKEVIVIGGSVGVQNKKSEVEIGKEVTFEDPNSAVVGDEVEIDKKAVVQDIYYNKLKNKGEILGTENTPLSLPVIDKLPNLPDFLPGDESIKVEKGESLSLPPGNYDKIKVKKQATLIFEGGIYSISSIKAEKETSILFDDATEIIVQDKIKIGKKSFFGPSDGSGLSASDILIFAVGKDKESNDDDDMDYGDDDKKDDDKDSTSKKNSKVEFKKESTVFANIFAPNGKIEIGKETHATGAFVANKVEVQKESILELDSKLEIIILIDEYSNLIKDLQEINNISDEEIIDFLESKIQKLRETVSMLESKGFTVEILVQRMSPTTSTILFINPFTLQSFEVEVPNSALAVLLTIGIFEEASLAVEFTGEEINAMLNIFPNVIDHIANLPDETFSIEFIEFVSCVGIANSASECFSGAFFLFEILHQLAQHPEIIDFIAELAILEGFPDLVNIIFPQASVSGFKFNDLDNSGARNEATEPLLPKWNFTITSKLIGGIDSGIQTKGQTNDAGFYFFNDLDYLPITETIVIIEDLDQNLIDQGWVHTTPSVMEIPFERDLVRTDINFGNRQEAILEVITLVTNDDGGSLEPSDFIVHVTGNNAEPADFSGNSVAVEVIMTPGEYSVSQDSTPGYATSLSDDCIGNIKGGESERKICTITNNDDSFLPPFDITKIVASNAQSGDRFGNSVSIFGDTAIVGASQDDSGACFGCGSAYIFEKDSAGVWAEVQRISASDKATNDGFGASVSIFGDMVLVGATGDDDNSIINSGSAYIFERNSAGVWTEVQKIVASDRVAGDIFGNSVSISGDRAVVGSPFNNPSGRGSTTAAGAAYIFEKDSAGVWAEVQKIVVSDPDFGGLFGVSVAISGDRVIGGASFNNGGGVDSGAAYIFEKDSAGVWAEIQKIVASDPNAVDFFGNSVSVSGDMAIVGAPENDAAGFRAGAVYIFKKDSAGVWTEVQKIVGSDVANRDFFGGSASISGNRVIVGAFGADDAGGSSGAVYIFKKDSAGVWTEAQKILAPDADAGDRFGFSVFISDDMAIVGATGDDSLSGSAYVIENIP